MLKLKNISKSFGNEVVLNDLCLEVNHGETLVIVGPSGAGKSVLLKIIMTLLDPDHGQIFLDDFNITNLNEAERMKITKRFGMLFQGAALFDSLTVKENVGFVLYQSQKTPNGRDVENIVREKLALVGMEHVMDTLPSDLSGGMKKRVGLARAIAHDPDIILYDEPTTGLDPIMANTINKLIIDLKNKLGVTSIVVTHDMHSAFMIADRIALLHEGGIRVIGTCEEIKNSQDPILKGFIQGELIDHK